MKNLSIFIVFMCAFIAVAFWWLPPDLKSPVTHSGWFRSIASVFGSDTRVMIVDNSYPWRSIGIVHGGRSTPWLCTGFLIGPNKVVTSRHCVMDDKGQAFPDIKYSVVRNTHYGRLTFNARRVRTIPMSDETLEGQSNHARAASDLAVIDIGDSVGERVGHFGTVQSETVTPSYLGSMADEDIQSMNELCRDTISELPWTLAGGGPSIPGMLGFQWVAPDPENPPRICAAGFSGDLGYARLSVAHDCGLLGLDHGVIVHNCMISNGASGGPLFYLDGSGAPVAFATNTATVESEAFDEMFGEEQLFVGTMFTALID